MRLHLRFPWVRNERGAYLFRYAVIVALLAAGCFLAFTTVGQETVDRIWALGEKIAGA